MTPAEAKQIIEVLAGGVDPGMPLHMPTTMPVQRRFGNHL